MNQITKIEGCETLLEALRRMKVDNRWSDFPMEARIALVGSLTSEKWSARQIGDIFGVTRNAIIGFARRQNIQLYRPDQKKKQKPAALRQVIRKSPAKTPPMKIAPTRTASEVLPPAFKPIMGATSRHDPVTYRETETMMQLLDLRENNCKMPLWDGGKPPVEKMFFCGADTGTTGRSYCRSCERGLLRVSRDGEA